MPAYLNKNATSLADANWSDTSGFSATYPLLVVNDIIGTGTVPITGDVDHSGETEGVYYFDIRAGARGILGTPANPLRFDADNESASAEGDQATAYVSNYGSGVTLHYVADGDDNSCRNLSVGTGNFTYVYGGTVVNAGQSGGRFEANQSTVITNFDTYGGSSEIEYNATAITLYRAMAGTHIVRRKVTAFEIGGTAIVYYLPDSQVTDFSSTSLKQTGGTFIQDRGAIPTINSLAGKHDFSQLREAITPGGTAWNIGGGRIISSELLDDSNAVNLYGTKRPVSGLTQLD